MVSSSVNILFRKAEILDGTGAQPFVADVAIAGKRIAAIGPDLDCAAEQILDCEGLTLAPGFIDTHTHDDAALLNDRGLECKISQGVTSVVLGNCGISLAPYAGRAEGLPDPFRLIAEESGDFLATIGAYFSRLATKHPAVNYAALVGHSTLRLGAGVAPDQAACEAKRVAMASVLDRALCEGAKGLSLGLEYPAASAADKEEIAALLPLLKKHGAVLAAHIRSESDEIVAAIDEVATLARLADVSLVLSHHKCSGKHNFGRSIETLALIEKAAEKQKIVFDAYPYNVGMSVLLAPFVEMAEKTILSSSKPHPELNGKGIRAVAKHFDCTAEEAIRRVSPATALYHIMDEGDVRRILAHPLGMIGSDGLHDARPHPRLWGTFPRFLGRYARDLGLLSWPEAIRKITSLPAKTFVLSQRGELKEGYYADLVLFDKAKIRDAATFENPTQKSEGIESVFVSGLLAWNKGQSTGKYAGERL
ncbi:MAG: D-aminoacylase [Alphaproteobacteria bacterium]|nr:D-aminoacylase [Alphaproteobacteria bacterium]